jgi:uncharacterized membrane protein
MVTLSWFKKIHQFLTAQAFYAIAFSSFFALLFFIGRALYTQNTVIYRNLVWNLFLAWIPYVFSIIAAGFHFVYPRTWWLLIIPGCIWLIFFPNAPYILTDFLHLTSRPPVPLWYDIGLLAIFAWSGLFLAVASLRTMQELVKYHLNWFAGWIFVMSALSLGGLGLYLGRFSRWNSWDLLTQPKEIVLDLAYRFIHPFSNMQFYGFTIMFTVILLICYLMFISVGNTFVKPGNPPQEKSILPD